MKAQKTISLLLAAGALVCSTLASAQTTATNGSSSSTVSTAPSTTNSQTTSQTATADPVKAKAMRDKREAEEYIRKVKGDNVYISMEERRRLYREYEKKKALENQDKEGG